MTPEFNLKVVMLTVFLQNVVPILATGLTGILGWAGAQLAGKWGADKKATKVQHVAAWLAELAAVVAADFNATIVPEYKARIADGVLTKAEITQLRDLALARIKKLAGEKGLAEAQAIFGITAPVLDEYLKGKVELAVAGLKDQAASTRVAIPPQ